jgi:phosphate starvation-inducible PhoH-like protein
MSVKYPNSGKRFRDSNAETNAEEFECIKPLNFMQSEYLRSIAENDITFGVGPAGTGKTFIAAGYSSEKIYFKKVSKVILTRPNVEAGDSMGFLPGDLEEKYLPYLQPFEQTFSKFLGGSFYNYCLKSGTITPSPIGFMRGLTFDNCIVLVDEAQNLTKTTLKMLLSRIGKGSKVILSGDPNQVDIKDSGFMDAINRLSSIPGVGVVNFTADDIVRSKLCKKVILAYND